MVICIFRRTLTFFAAPLYSTSPSSNSAGLTKHDAVLVVDDFRRRELVGVALRAVVVVGRTSCVSGTVTLLPSSIIFDGGTSNNHTRRASWSSDDH
jgi:hypothetical protein